MLAGVCRRRLSSLFVVVCNAAGGQAGRPPGAWAVGQLHYTAGQYGHVPLGRHLVILYYALPADRLSVRWSVCSIHVRAITVRIGTKIHKTSKLMEKYSQRCVIDDAVMKLLTWSRDQQVPGASAAARRASAVTSSDCLTTTPASSCVGRGGSAGSLPSTTAGPLTPSWRRCSTPTSTKRSSTTCELCRRQPLKPSTGSDCTRPAGSGMRAVSVNARVTSLPAKSCGN